MAAAQPAFSPVDALLHAWATNNRIDIYLIENVPEEAWRAKPPNGKGRDIASLFVHMHKCQADVAEERVWIRTPRCRRKRGRRGLFQSRCLVGAAAGKLGRLWMRAAAEGFNYRWQNPRF